MGWETNGSPDCCHMPLVTLSLRCQILEIFSKPCAADEKATCFINNAHQNGFFDSFLNF